MTDTSHDKEKTMIKLKISVFNEIIEVTKFLKDGLPLSLLLSMDIHTGIKYDHQINQYLIQ